LAFASDTGQKQNNAKTTYALLWKAVSKKRRNSLPFCLFESLMKNDAFGVWNNTVDDNEKTTVFHQLPLDRIAWLGAGVPTVSS
jgi:hypothetical protein